MATEIAYLNGFVERLDVVDYEMVESGLLIRDSAGKSKMFVPWHNVQWVKFGVE